MCVCVCAYVCVCACVSVRMCVSNIHLKQNATKANRILKILKFIKTQYHVYNMPRGWLPPQKNIQCWQNIQV